MTLNDINKTAEEMMEAAVQVGVTWKGRDYSPQNPVLSSCVEQSIQELGTSDLVATMNRAAMIWCEQDYRDKQVARAQREALGRELVAAAPTVRHDWVNYNEAIASLIPASEWSVSDVRRFSYAIRFFSNSFGEWTREELRWMEEQEPILVTMLNALEAMDKESEERELNEPVPVAFSRTQLWEPCDRCGTEPSYLTPQGHFCDGCK